MEVKVGIVSGGSEIGKRMIDFKLLMGSVKRLMELVRGVVKMVLKVVGQSGSSEMGVKVGGVSGVEGGGKVE